MERARIADDLNFELTSHLLFAGCVLDERHAVVQLERGHVLEVSWNERKPVSETGRPEPFWSLLSGIGSKRGAKLSFEDASPPAASSVVGGSPSPPNCSAASANGSFRISACTSSKGTEGSSRAI